ncbi:hypothetical protein ALC57_16324 [Trachymyrmex cornetzi]|uniref:Uncharacterized protein n=1 Tax=Trachymyrmex cornetzi TaxID=471704 RepID=A0A195DF61_9HYME|nr:hypothetical protein ALC57_16324 [Trachymyrmex cornetzi]
MYCICVSCRICALIVVTIDENTSFSSEPHYESWEAGTCERNSGDFQRAARRGGTCFDDDADHYPSYAAAKSLGEGFAKKRAASLISSIRRPGNASSKLPVEFTLEDTH